jgi:excisionase family DNA binding protein
MEMALDKLSEAINELHKKVDHLTAVIEKLHFGKHEDSILLNITEAAELLNYKVRTIYDKVYKKELPGYKKGKNLYFYKHELLAYIESGKVKTQRELIFEAEAFMKESSGGSFANIDH